MVQVFEALGGVGKPFFYEGLHFWTRRGVAVAQVEQGGDIVEGEARRLRRADKAEPRQGGVTVDTIVSTGPVMRVQEPNALIVSNRGGRYASLLGKLSNRVSSHKG